MFQPAIKNMKWISVPLLLIGSLFSRYAVGFELLIDMALCIGAMILLQRAACGPHGSRKPRPPSAPPGDRCEEISHLPA